MKDNTYDVQTYRFGIVVPNQKYDDIYIRQKIEYIKVKEMLQKL